MSKNIIIGNWKMNPVSMKEAEKLFSLVVKGVSGIKKTEVLLCPPFVFLDKLSKVRTSKVVLGAQDAFFGEVGAFTGQVSSEMLSNLKITHAIIGHSERRAIGEVNLDINKKIKAAIAAGVSPILCVGESVRDESHAYFNLVKTQLEECLAGVPKNLISKVMVAYEPVWAISTTLNRKDATPKDAYEMVIFIRKVLSDKFGPDATKIRVLYGGSVNEKDAGEFLENGGVDGLLVGRASLDADKFIEIIKTCEVLKK